MAHLWLFRLFAKHDLDDSSRSGSNTDAVPVYPARSMDMSGVSNGSNVSVASYGLHGGDNGRYAATCISSEIRRSPNGHGRFTVFRVLVTCSGEQWWLFKRFTDFRALHDQLRKELPGHPLPSLPARRFFGDSFSKSFLAKRRAGLHAYLLGVVDDATVRSSAALLSFLDDGRHVLHLRMGVRPLQHGISSSQLSASTSHTSQSQRSGGAAAPVRKASSHMTLGNGGSSVKSKQRTGSAVARVKAMPGSRSRSGSLASVRKGGEMRKLAPAAPVMPADSTIARSHSNSLDSEAALAAAANATSVASHGRFSVSTEPPASPMPTGSQRKMGLDDFCLLSVIGKGSYGKVMLARHKSTNKVYAIKAISKSKIRGRPADIRRIMSEREVLRRNATHPFLIGLRYSFQSTQKLYLCIDYVSGGELFFHLQRDRRFPEQRARFYACEILSALSFLHDLGFVYRDLKPENLLLDSEGHIRLVDFGLAKNTGDGKTSTFCGTPEYLAPEVLRQQRYGKEVDWYCFGSVLYEMLVGLPPFYSPNDREMFDRILNERLRFPSIVGKAARILIMGLLERNPQLRLGSQGADEVKRQAFFRGVDWDRVYRKDYPVPFDPQVGGTMDLHNIDPKFCGEPIPASLLDEIRGNELLNQARDLADAELVKHEQEFEEAFFDVPGLDDSQSQAPAHHQNQYQTNANNGYYGDLMADDGELDPHGDLWDAAVDQAMNEMATEAEITQQVDNAFAGFSYAPDTLLGSAGHTPR